MSQDAPTPLGVQPPSAKGPTLARHIGLFSLIVYGVGDMVGAGIYGTIGNAAGALGNAVWMAFIASMVAAMLTGLSYASIASRYPRAAGAAYVTHRAFRLTFLSYVVGLAVMASGLTSIGASSNAFAQTLRNFLPSLPLWSIIVLFLGLLTLVNFWGIRESMWANLLCTAVEVGGLLFIIVVGVRYWGGVNYLQTPDTSAGAGLSSSLILSGAVLTFFSFVGFEDMLNVAEEVKRPQVTMPWGIVLALLVTTVIYIAVSITAVSVVDYRDLSNGKLGAPIAQISQKAAPWLSSWVFTAITLFAVANTALLNYVMGSRLAYGMARQGLLPRILGLVHARRRTPYAAILALLVVALSLALAGNIPNLARATALLLLSVFVIVNAALLVLKLRKGEPRGRFEVPAIVPVGGILFCGLLIANAQRAELQIAGVLLAGICVLYVIMRPRATEESLAAAEEAADPLREG